MVSKFELCSFIICDFRIADKYTLGPEINILKGAVPQTSFRRFIRQIKTRCKTIS